MLIEVWGFILGLVYWQRASSRAGAVVCILLYLPSFLIP
jgi:hypothetical protein